MTLQRCEGDRDVDLLLAKLNDGDNTASSSSMAEEELVEAYDDDFLL